MDIGEEVDVIVVEPASPTPMVEPVRAPEPLPTGDGLLPGVDSRTYVRHYRSMEIGPPQRTIIIEPLEEPVPQVQPTPIEEPSPLVPA